MRSPAAADRTAPHASLAAATVGAAEHAGPLLDLRRTLAVHRTGAGDPTIRLSDHECWRATLTPDGPGTVHLWRSRSGFDAEAWGPGGEWLLARLPAFLGEHDDPSALVPRHRVVADAARVLRAVRIGRSDGVLHALVPAVLGQRVTSVEAMRQWRQLCLALGRPAPGPRPLRLPPEPAVLASTPYWWFHRFGIERRRADTIRRVAVHADRLEETAPLPLADAWARLLAVPGVGPWTAAEVAGAAFGDPDAVPVGDYHVPDMVAFALAGEPRGDDQRMLELLEPYRGQRGRVVRLLAMAGHHAPRFGPRRAIPPVAAW